MEHLQAVGWIRYFNGEWHPCSDCLHWGWTESINESIKLGDGFGLCWECQLLPEEGVVRRPDGWASLYNPKLHGIVH